jgi:hypothetical protein
VRTAYIAFLKQHFVNNKILVFLFLLLLFLFIYAYVDIFQQQAFVQIDIDSNITTNFKIYWAGKTEGYSENRSSAVRINRAKKKYTFSIGDLGSIEKLRIDPADNLQKAARIVIKSILIKQNGYTPISFSTGAEFKRLIPSHHIKTIRNRLNNLLIVTSGSDPQLEVYLNRNVKKHDYPIEIIRLLFVFILLAGFWVFVGNVGENYNYVPYFMVFIFALILIMASISRGNSHPDEYVHVRAGAYYEDHWLPPKVGDPEIDNTYSVYGVSRLYKNEIVYFFAGKFSKILCFLPLGNKYFRFRFLNIFLFFILLLLNCRYVEYRLVSIPLLISPQVWYVFSYFNSDAFSLFIIFIISYQVLSKKSLLNRFLDRSEGVSTFIYLISLGILFSMLLFLKKNFYIFVIFLFLYLMWSVYYREIVKPKLALKRIGLAALVAVGFFGAVYSIDTYINGFEKSEKIVEVREKMAASMYKPSTKLEDKHPRLQLRERGVSISDIFARYRWGESSFRSFFGVYGYTSISASKNYYNFFRVVVIVFVSFISFSIVFKSGIRENILLLMVCACSFFLIGLSLWHSWTNDFQAQGRYLLPICAMLGFLLFKSENHFNKSVFNFLSLSMFLLSLYSFIFVGLVNIPKY